MAALSIFPARIRFVNADGTLTPEAYRALRILFDRVGGALGDNGENVFAAFGSGDADNLLGEVLARETLMQPAPSDEADMLFPDVVQPAGGNAMDKIVVKAGTAALPSITTEGDENTGVYFPAADSVGVTSGGTERLRVGSAVSIPSGQRIYLDGLAGTGDTYLVESAPNVVDFYVGGVLALTVKATGIAGAAAGLTGTAYGLTAGNLVAGSGVTGTFGTFSSVTFSNGLVTSYTP